MLTANPLELKSENERKNKLHSPQMLIFKCVLPLIELLRAELGMLMGAEDLVIRLLFAKLADRALSRCSSMEQAVKE